MDFLRGKKTYIIAGLMVLVSLVKLIAGDMSIVEAISSPHINLLLQGFGLGTLRAGVEKTNAS